MNGGILDNEPETSETEPEVRNKLLHSFF